MASRRLWGATHRVAGRFLGFSRPGAGERHRRPVSAANWASVSLCAAALTSATVTLSSRCALWRTVHAEHKDSPTPAPAVPDQLEEKPAKEAPKAPSVAPGPPQQKPGKDTPKAPLEDKGNSSKKVVSSTAAPDPEKELLHRQRFVLLMGSIDEKLARSVCSQLMYLDSVDSRAPITLVINSSGGTITEGLAIYDTMRYVKAPVYTLCMGQASSMATLLVAGGARGQRKSLPNSRFMTHSASNSIDKLQTEDVIIRAEELKEKNELLLRILAQDTGKDPEQLRDFFGRNYYMSASRAKELGIIDTILLSRPEGL